jgi:hypothetical protein
MCANEQNNVVILVIVNLSMMVGTGYHGHDFYLILRSAMMKFYKHAIAILFTAYAASPLLVNAADKDLSGGASISADTSPTDGNTSTSTDTRTKVKPSHKRNRNETKGTSGNGLNTDPDGRYKDIHTGDKDTSESVSNTATTNTDTIAAPRKNRNETRGTSGNGLNTDPSGRYKDRRAGDDNSTTSGNNN